MARLWAKIIVKHKIHRQATCPCVFSQAPEALQELCKEFDVPNPIWLGKQQREFCLLYTSPEKCPPLRTRIFSSPEISA